MKYTEDVAPMKEKRNRYKRFGEITYMQDATWKT